MEKIQLKPFLKWAGGKSQLLNDIRDVYPDGLGKTITKYAEPFVGGGAVLFDILSSYNMKEIYISDINKELINTYCVVRDDVDSLLSLLHQLEKDYLPLDDDQRKDYYIKKRTRFNELKMINGVEKELVETAALMIFLNRTCFNGLYRVNKSGLFNVPIGAYKKPRICDSENLRLISSALQNVKIEWGDYKQSAGFIDAQTFVYFDPPFRPLNQTANFVSYNEVSFDDSAQCELAEFVKEMDKKGAKFALSNSDPQNLDTDDYFFDDLYKGFHISRVQAARMINSNRKGRGKISELLITNNPGALQMNRTFDNWLATFKASIADYGYYIDFEKVHRNVDAVRVELNILNSLIGSKNIEADFKSLMGKYPEVLKCIPLLLAVRAKEISAVDCDGEYVYSFNKQNQDVEQYGIFMRKTGLFDLLENHIINNLVDYATGVETGLDSNGRKNRGGHLMENLVENYIQKAGFIKEETYFKEVYLHEITDKWNIDLSALSNHGKMEKRFDFVIKTPSMIYGIETNFYSGGGSKLNETARSYKTLALETDTIDGFTFVWFTDGKGWTSARNNLEETFDVMEHIYNIADLEAGIIHKICK